MYSLWDQAILGSHPTHELRRLAFPIIAMENLKDEGFIWVKNLMMQPISVGKTQQLERLLAVAVGT